MKNIVFSTLLMLSFGFFTCAQHQDIPSKPNIWKTSVSDSTKSEQLLNYFRAGTFHGHFRHFFMATDNSGDLTDFYANAIGGGIRFETANFYGFKFGVSGFYFFNLLSSDLTQRDPQTNQLSRYEIGLFDVEHPDNKKDMDRLEELFLKYGKEHFHVTVGRQLINTPFINLQDGRMRPTGVEGLYFDADKGEVLKLEGGYIHAIAPRSTTRWYSTDNTIGIYPSGVNINGEKSNYYHNLSSKGNFISGLHIRPMKGINIHIWDLFVENILNTAMVQADIVIPSAESREFIIGLQTIQQHAVNNGGNADPTMSYTHKGAKSATYGVKVGYRIGNIETTFNFNRITAMGRYLMPREWGRDPFFTFMPRERNEGFGDVTAMTTQVSYLPKDKKLRAGLTAGYFRMPDVLNFALNKYGQPSYAQLNADIRYVFGGFFNGMDAQLLVVAKKGIGETYENPNYVFNKVDMVLYNLVVNYHF